MTDQPTPPGSAGSSAADDDFEALLVLALERLEAEGPASVERMLAERPEQAPKLRAHLEQLQRLGLNDDGAAPHVHPERLGEFRIVAPLGQGGMGVVYRAVQESLGREVALKLIRPDQLYFPGARERFRREVELVARMQHPGIVPVYAVGSEAGIPYFAMELVHGATLADVITRLAGRDPKTLDGGDLDQAVAQCLGQAGGDEPAELFRGAWTPVVLRIVREVAEALEHAHRRGVMHRDVKPSNVMLTRAGRVLLLDFGLAGANSTERLTRTGSALGSLAYMPPELLAGTAVTRDATGDIYSLGATCWELLALRLPYQSSDPLQLRQLAAAAVRPKLSTLNPTVSWDVATVIATALEPDPARRYATASLFSRDLDNVLAHRPIEAREPGVWLRLRRWTQRHPARATAAVALIGALVGGPSLWAWQESRARAGIEAQRDELAKTNLALDKARGTAEAQSKHARTNFAKLQQAVDTMLTKVGDEGLRDIPRMETVRRELLTEALRFYASFLAEEPDDPALRIEAARVRLRTADVHALLGDYTAARDEVARAIEQMLLLQDLDPSLAPDLAHAQHRLATARRLLGDLPGAQVAATAAIAGWRALTAKSAAADAAYGLGGARIEWSLIAADRGDLAGASAELESSLNDIGAWQQAHPDDPALTHLEARTLDRAAIWLLQTAMQSRDRAHAMPQVERAAGMHARARALWQSVMARAPNDSQVRADAAQSAISMAIPLQLLGRLQESREVLEAGVGLIAVLVADFPASQRRRSELANARCNLAAVLGQLEATQDSVQQSIAARELWEGLLKESPASDEYAIGLSHALQGQALGMWYSQTPAKDVLPLLEASGAAADRALAVRPDNPTYRRTRRKVAETAAEVCIDLADHRKVVGAAQRLTDADLAPTQPVLAAALIARAIPLAAADPALGADERAATAAGYRKTAEDLLEAAVASGLSPALMRADPTLANQWGKPGFDELWQQLEKKAR
jgi:serine/threonine protein kinase